MKYIIRYALLLVVFAAVASSCKKPVPDQVKYIPKDAMMVLDINWKSLSDKASKANIQWDSLFRSMAGAGSGADMDEGKKMLQDFMRSGIDTTKDIFFFLKMGGSIMAGQSVSGGVVGVIKDQAGFEAYIKKQPRAGEIQKGSGYSYIKLENNLYAGWNSDVVIVAGAQNTQNFQGGSDGGASSSVGGDAQLLAALFAQKEEESVSAIPEFRDLMAEKGDVLFWNNSSSILSTVPLLGMTKIADLFKDSYGAGVINFDEGKVTGSFKSYSGKDLAAIWDKYKGPTVNMDMVNSYPVPADGFAAFSFNPQIVNEIIKYGGLEGMVKQFFEKAGYTLEDVLKVFKGDFAVVFSDIAYTNAPYSVEGMEYTIKRPVAKLIFNAAINDKAAYDKIAARLAEQGMMEMRNGQYVPTDLNGMAWNMDGKNLIIATDSALLQQYLAGKGNAALPTGIASQAKGKSIAMYVDINKMVSGFAEDSTGGGKAARSAQATFKNAMATSENYNGKFVAANAEVNMVNDKENSLVSLIKFFASVSQQVSRMEKRLDHNMDDMDMEDVPHADSMVPPMPEKE